MLTFCCIYWVPTLCQTGSKNRLVHVHLLLHHLVLPHLDFLSAFLNVKEIESTEVRTWTWSLQLLVSNLPCCTEILLWPQGHACPLPIRHRGHWLDCEDLGCSTLCCCTHFWWNLPTVQRSVICIVLFNNCLVVSCHIRVRAWNLLFTWIQAPSLTHMPTPSGC